MREVEVNVAYRWFLRLRLRDKVPGCVDVEPEPAAAFSRERRSIRRSSMRSC